MNALVKTANPFGASKPTSSALVETESQRSIAEVQAALVIAKQFPRNPIEAMDKILNACQRPKLAGSALYSYARGGTDITGPSIRLAEAIALTWGNLQFGIRELSSSNGESTVEAFAWDVETNTRQTKIFQVPHMRYSKSKGNTKLTDPRDIYELIANNGARRLRACILGVIPGDVIEAAVEQCEETIKASADTSPEGIKKLIAAFEAVGVEKAAIEKRIQRKIDAITAAQVVSLRKIYTSIKEGMSSTSEWFKGVPVESVVKTTQIDLSNNQAEFDRLVSAIESGDLDKVEVLSGERYIISDEQRSVIAGM